MQRCARTLQRLRVRWRGLRHVLNELDHVWLLPAVAPSNLHGVRTGFFGETVRVDVVGRFFKNWLEHRHARRLLRVNHNLLPVVVRCAAAAAVGTVLLEGAGFEAVVGAGVVVLH